MNKWMSALVVILICCVSVFFVLPQINNAVSTITTPTFSPAVTSMASLMSILFVVMIFLYMFKSLGTDSPEEQIDWLRYGNRLKLAYAAKFGGENSGFNGEVDYKIKIMVNTDKGYTRQLAKDWVKRMSKFVEIEWLKLDDSNDET